MLGNRAHLFGAYLGAIQTQNRPKTKLGGRLNLYQSHKHLLGPEDKLDQGFISLDFTLSSGAGIRRQVTASKRRKFADLFCIPTFVKNCYAA